MRAPTPVRALVHSSTLVTGGLVLLFNFSFLLINKIFILVLILFGLITMLFSRVRAILEEDMKKIVALSTLSQMGFIILSLGINLIFICIVHIVGHAFFKRSLFIQVGYVIHKSFSKQDKRSYMLLELNPFFFQAQLGITLLCLCGLIFSSGSVSKEIILFYFFNNIMLVIFMFVFLMCVFMTFIYSFRL
jgi:NADH-ubiquinone oxidoreductase chain 5